MVTHTYLIHQQAGANKNKIKNYRLFMRKKFMDHFDWIWVTEEHFHKWGIFL